MLNWRRDPGYEQRVMQHELRMLQYEQRKMQHELRMKQLKSEIEQIKKETEQLRRENARQKALSALIKQHCFPPESNSTPIPPIEPGSSSS
jgi:multidrug resistance efflux pump